MSKSRATSQEFYEALRELLPGLPDPSSVMKTVITLEAEEVAKVDITSYASNDFKITTKRYELKVRE